MFLCDWYEVELNCESCTSKNHIPTQLLLLHRWISNHGEMKQMFNTLLDFSSFIQHGNVYVFYVESQWTYEWAFATGEDDPAVYGRQRDSHEWTLESEQLSEFLYQMMVFEAISNAPCLAEANCIPHEEAELALASFTKMGLGSWHWPACPTTFFKREFELAVSFPNSDGMTIMCGRRKDGALLIPEELREFFVVEMRM